ncbi:hypothetical protein HK105_203806 [Polyrhizophydium stewartii]|uniref:Uncharacterized protein n=1 Tax=Polyrhizophydium stewartii TaxID=2732419 RepID=A0ABR4NAZ6_9FUNG
MLKLASQLAHGAACRTVAEAHHQVAARAPRAVECRHDKIRAIADAAVDAAAKGFSHEKVALIDLASVKQDAIDHAMVTMAATQEAAKKAAAGEMAAAEAATAASSMSAGPAAAKSAFFTTTLIAAVTEARSKMRAADAQPISESAIIEHASMALAAAVRAAERAAAALAAATNAERMNNDKEPHTTAKKAAGAVSVESLTGSCDASSSTAENKAVSPSKDHAADPAAEEKQGGRRGSESSKGKKEKNAKKGKKAKKAKGKHLPACSVDKAVAAVQSASEDNDKGKTVMSAPGGALAVDKPQKKDSAVCLAEETETVGQNPAEDIAAAVTPRIAASVAAEAIGDAGCNTGRNTTDAASTATASTSVGTSGACAAVVGRPNGSSDPISKSNGAIKIAAVMRTVAPLAKAPANTAAHTNVVPSSKALPISSTSSISSSSSVQPWRSQTLTDATSESRFAEAMAARAAISSNSRPRSSTAPAAAAASSARPPLAPVHSTAAPQSLAQTQAEAQVVDISSASSLFRSSAESQKAVARYNRFWASLPDPEGSGTKTTRRSRASAPRPAPQERDHLALIRDIHHFSSGAFAWYDLQISDDDWSEVVHKYSRPLTSKDLV